MVREKWGSNSGHCGGDYSGFRPWRLEITGVGGDFIYFSLAFQLLYAIGDAVNLAEHPR